MSNEDEKLELDEELVKDFLEEFHDCNEELEQTLLALDQDPSSKDLINQLFRTIHTVKSNLRMVALDHLSEIIHALEDILDDVRKDRLQYVEGISDIILVVFFQVHELSVLSLKDNDEDENIDFIYDAVHHLCMVEPDQLQQEVHLTLQRIDPDGDYHCKDAATDENPVADDAAFAENSPDTAFKIDEDMDFFIELSQQLEDSLPHWQGRNTRMLDLCLEMNQLTNEVVSAKQLAAAVYTHDLGMTFIPNEIITKPAKLDADEEAILQNHCRLCFEWLKRIKGWVQAAHIVYQHHERFDGSGYPQGLKDNDICDGAKIIAIANTFEAMTSSRAYRKHKRPVMRAVLEINSNSDILFDEKWVDVFNQVIKNRSKK
jgi:chemotaxis protein histidine kinase CheA